MLAQNFLVYQTFDSDNYISFQNITVSFPNIHFYLYNESFYDEATEDTHEL